MKQNRNGDVRKELIIDICITLAAVLGCLFVEPWCAVIAFCAGAAITVTHYQFLRRRYDRIAELSRDIDSILHGHGDLKISESEEGELSILNSEIHKMLTRLREQTQLLTNDKVRLTEAIEDIFHQLRTPLTSMNLIVTLLANEELDNDRRLQLTRQLKRQLERMQWLIETLLKMSKISSGSAVFRSEKVLAGDVIREAAQPFLIPMELRGQELVIVDDNSAAFTGDASWSVEAFANIIKNCMEHTPEGGRVTVKIEENAISTNITISDTGEGFDPADIPYLFERFYKGSNASKESIGIGLAFARLIITEQNGTISASNGPGGGAVFNIKFYKSIV